MALQLLTRNKEEKNVTTTSISWNSRLISQVAHTHDLFYQFSSWDWPDFDFVPLIGKKMIS